MGTTRWAAMQATARVHVRFCMKLAHRQMEGNNYFLVEHPLSASIWRLPEVVQVAAQGGVEGVRADLCMYGMQTTDAPWYIPAQKPTRFMTNSQCLARTLSKTCDKKHRHAHLVDGRAHFAEVYPPQLCEAMLRGIRDQLRHYDKFNSINELFPVHDEPDIQEFVDDISGYPLDAKLVRKASEEELRHFREHTGYVKVPVSKSKARTGRGPIGFRWIDCNKGDATRMQVRSRLVAQYFKTDVNHELYAGAPPLESLKLVSSNVVTGSKSTCVMVPDISRAYLHAPAAGTFSWQGVLTTSMVMSREPPDGAY